MQAAEVIKPLTLTAHAAAACSYVEAVTSDPEKQVPSWFVSHPWIEAVTNFTKCLSHHEEVRNLTGQIFQRVLKSQQR